MSSLIHGESDNHIDMNYSLGVACAFYVVLFLLMPKLKGYAIRQEVEVLSDGAQTSILVKVPNDKLAEWDAIHNVQGESIASMQKI
jgi:hypothetical protein